MAGLGFLLVVIGFIWLASIFPFLWVVFLIFTGSALVLNTKK